MASRHVKDVLRRYLDDARHAMLWKMEGLSEYEVRRPLTAHGTNLLGLVKHLAGCEIGYFGYVFNRPFARPPDWLTNDASDLTRDMWATAEQSRHDIVDLYQRACAHSDATIAALGLDDRGEVPTWPEYRRFVTLHDILVHMIAETARHAGHADIVRELIDGEVGLRADRRMLPEAGADYWAQLHQRIEGAAREHR